MACALAAPAFADLGFPAYVKFPRQVGPADGQNLVDETIAEVEFIADKSGAKTARKGHHYVRWFAYKPAAGEKELGYYNGSEERISAAMLAPLTGQGWAIVQQEDNKSGFTLHRVKDGSDAWLAVSMDAPQGQVKVEMIELSAGGPAFKLTPPAAKPETFVIKADFPYLAPPTGSKQTASAIDKTGALDATPPGAQEPQLVGTGVYQKVYQGPSSLSQLQFMTDYTGALKAAGWTVIYPAAGKEKEGGAILAHYVKGERNIWTKLVYEYGAQLTFQVADVGGEDWAAKLDTDCRLPLYGVNFDYNKSTLKADSAPVLTKAADLLAKRAELKVEVQGHTDNVGGDAYNLQLSKDRAASVMKWLTDHKIAATRMTSQGYGKTQPVADNATDAGRAKNRRVELVKSGCKKP
jgi:outer membrane protein OmpA-like peptidoglycan-associated protein